MTWKIQIFALNKDHNIFTCKLGIDIADIIVNAGLANSKSEARRQITGRAFKMENLLITDPFARIIFDHSNKKWMVFERET